MKKKTLRKKIIPEAPIVGAVQQKYAEKKENNH